MCVEMLQRLTASPALLSAYESEVSGMRLRGIAASVAITLLGASMWAVSFASGTELYEVGADGHKVDKATLQGWRAWRALACERCHGAAQEGMVGPSLIQSLKVLSKEEFKQTVLKGRLEKGMPNFDGSKMVVDNIDGLYAYLKGRSDGAIQPGRLEELK
jgi:mono/diheme cytochrome c family protein